MNFEFHNASLVHRNHQNHNEKESIMIKLDDKFALIDVFNPGTKKMGFSIVPHCPPVPPYQNGKRTKSATPADILNGGPVGFVRSVDPSSMPLGNGWHGRRKKDHGYRGSESSTSEDF